jgi:hypothetical protein
MVALMWGGVLFLPLAPVYLFLSWFISRKQTSRGKATYGFMWGYLFTLICGHIAVSVILARAEAVWFNEEDYGFWGNVFGFLMFGATLISSVQILVRKKTWA